ncbi:hypothetical protein EC3006_0392, partial [Escherichia coli 3006]
APKP